MKINDVRILNLIPDEDGTGVAWWKHVKNNPDLTLIKAVIMMELTHREYDELLNRDRLLNEAQTDPTGIQEAQG